MHMRMARMNREELKGRNLDRRSLRRAWRFVGAYRLLLAGYLACIAAAAVLGVIPPLLLKRLIDFAIPNKDLGAVDLIAAGLVALALVSGGLSLLNRWLGARIGEGVIYDLRTALFDHVQRMPLAFFTRTQTGSLMSRLTTDVLDAQNAVSTLASVLSDVLVLATTLAAMLVLDWEATLLALAVVPAFFLLDRRMAGYITRLARLRLNLNASMSTIMTERFNVSGALLVKLFGRPSEEHADFSRKAARVRDTGVQQAFAGRILFAALTLIGAVGTAAVYWIGSRAVVRGELKIGTVVALAAYVTRLYQPLSDLAGARVDLLGALVSFERVFEVLDAPRAIDDAPDAIALPAPARGRVVADAVWFRYPAPADVSIASLEAGPEDAELATDPSAWVLEGISFAAEPGTMTALVGPSGAGKTTLSTLIPRLYDVSQGSITVDGLDVRQLTLASLTAAIGVVTQDAHLFHESVAMNLRYARPDATDAELEEVCRAARIHEVITALPDGYDTIVGERGYRLSGGEKQRLAIARMLLKDPAVVILDEATAHLDSETELLIQQALAEALAGRTSIVIAHRLSTIKAADQILVMDRGHIVERGTHDTLVAAGGLYSELYQTQYSRGPAPASPADVPG
jgi:ATP-binding cassette subfamily B protein